MTSQTIQATPDSKLKLFIEHKWFQNTIMFFIMLNSIQLGLQTSAAVNEAIGPFLNTFDRVCLGIFVVELVLKLIVYRSSFFKDGFNIFDMFIVVVSLLSDLALFSVFRMFRTFRVLRSLRNLRALRMITGVGKLNIIITAIGKSIPSIAWTSLLLGIIYYVFAVMGTTLFGESFPQWFGNIGRSMYTLFQVMTLESWSMGISRPVMEAFPWAWVYFVPFVLISAFVMMNVVVGIVVNTISEATGENENHKTDIIDPNEKPSTAAQLKAEIHALKEQISRVELLIEQTEAEKQ